MPNKFPFHQILVLITLICVNLAACNTTPAVTPTATMSVETPKPTAAPHATATPDVAPTKDPMAGAPEGATAPDGKGGWIQKIGDLTYTYDEKEHKFTREVGEFSPMDLTAANYFTLKVTINSDVNGAQNLVSLTHTDVTSDNDPSPLKSVYVSALLSRLGKSITNDNDWVQLQEDMLGMNGGHAYLPVTFPNGEHTEHVQIILREATGVITEIVNPKDLIALVGKGVTKWKDPRGNTYYSGFFGVDASGNGIYKIASEAPLPKFSEMQVRWMIFSGVGNLLTREDQREQTFTTLTDIFAQYSARPRADGTKDVGIVRNP